MSTGTVKFFNEGKGFGFIIEDETEANFFVHHSEVVGDPITDGDKVEFTKGESEKGPHAEQVKKITD